MREILRLLRLYRIIKELKRRRLFQSLILTNTKLEIDFWDGRQTVIGDENTAMRYLKALEETDRREIEWVTRYGRTPASKRA